MHQVRRVLLGGLLTLTGWMLACGFTGCGPADVGTVNIGEMKKKSGDERPTPPPEPPKKKKGARRPPPGPATSEEARKQLGR